MTTVFLVALQRLSFTTQDIVTNPAYHDYLAVLKGARNGLVYGARVRFAHSLVLAILFGRGNWKSRLLEVLRATKEHAVTVAGFVFCYKLFLLLLKRWRGGKQHSSHNFICGALAGYIMAERSIVNEQIVFYGAARAVASLIPRDSTSRSSLLENRGRPLPPDRMHYAVFSAIVWGVVMWVFQNRAERLQYGMWQSFQYLHRDSEVWTDLRTLLWHNK